MRQLFAAIFLTLSLSVVCLQSCEKNSEQLPNIIFFLSDDQNKNEYGCYGNDKIHTPGVDRLAREGMLFENAFTAQAICAPSRSQLYTGNYPLKNGCFLNHSKTKASQESVTKYMRELGYEVILAGKSHVQPASVYDWDREWHAIDKEGYPRAYIPLDSIESYFSKADRPFCMFVASYYPHAPYFDVETKSADNFKFYPYDEQRKGDPAYLKRLSGRYRNIEEENTQLEAVLELVDEYLDDNTLFIYSADHGSTDKFTVYDLGLNIPFVVRWPEVVKAGSRSDVMIHFTDVVPTFIEIAGGRAVEHIDGKSFLPVLKGQNEEIHEYVYGVQTNQNIQRAAVFPSRMIRNKKFKYIRNFNSVEVMEKNFGENEYVNAFIRMGAMKFKDKPFEELYDIENDPFEQVNLARDPAYKNIKEQLAIDMFHWMKDQGDILSDDPGNMPLIKSYNFRLDHGDRFKTVPDSLENTLKDEDYYILDYLK